VLGFYKKNNMKKYSILFLFLFSTILLCTNSLSAQEKSKKVTDTAHACKPTKSGKHCAAPVKKAKQ
jgi:hypothetical protein